MATAEFVLPQVQTYDRRTPVRWILSHASRHWWLVIMTIAGAIGNAILAAAIPILVGQAFNAILNTIYKVLNFNL